MDFLEKLKVLQNEQLEYFNEVDTLKDVLVELLETALMTQRHGGNVLEILDDILEHDITAVNELTELTVPQQKKLIKYVVGACGQTLVTDFLSELKAQKKLSNRDYVRLKRSINLKTEKQWKRQLMN